MNRKATLPGWFRASLATLFVFALPLASFGTAGGAPPSAPDAPFAPVTPNWPANGATGISTPPALAVTVPGSNTSNVTVNFYGKPVSATPGPDFSVIALPDTENEVVAANQPYGATAFNDDTQWVANNWTAAKENIAFVSHLGDIVSNGNASVEEWTIADTAMKKLENNPPNVTSPNQIPIGITAGRWDVEYGSDLFEQYFGVARFTGRSYYGGSFDGVSNLNNYVLFSAGGMDFIVVDLFCPGPVPPVVNPPDAVLAWAGNLLQTNASRRAIVVCHALFDLNSAANPIDFTSNGARIFNALKGYPNLFLLLGGYRPGVYMRQDTYNGRTIYSMSADYQNWTYLNGSGVTEQGGVGWMRHLKFSPANNLITVRDFSPHTGQAQMPWTLPYDMQYQVIGGQANVAPGARANVPWPNLARGTAYEWFVTVSDGQTTTTSAHWTFTTAAAAAPTVTQQPADRIAAAGQTASFTAAATGSPPLTVQWQVSANGGGTWTNAPGNATSPTYSFTAQSGDNGKAYRAVFSNSGGAAITNPAILSISTPPAVTTQPANRSVTTGQTATFTAAASGNPAPTVQWQVSSNGGGTWTNIGGATATTYSFVAHLPDSGKQFRAVFTNTAGSATSQAATLVVARIYLRLPFIGR